MAFSACGGSGSSSSSPEKAYYGTWVVNYGTDDIPDLESVTISANKLEYYIGDNLEYVMENLTWEEIENVDVDTQGDYPTGFAITGTLTYRNNYAPFKVGTSGYGSTGDTVIDYWYIHTDKKSLSWGSWGDAFYGVYKAFVAPPYVKK